MRFLILVCISFKNHNDFLNSKQEKKFLVVNEIPRSCLKSKVWPCVFSFGF